MVSLDRKMKLTIAMFFICLIVGLIVLAYGMGTFGEPQGWHGLYVGMGLFLLGIAISASLQLSEFDPKVIAAMWVALGIIITAVVATGK